MTRLGRLAATALMLFAASSAWSQEPTRPTVMPIPPLGQGLRIEKMADIPPSLNSAIAHARCQLDEWLLHDSPIQIIRPGPRAIALVTCFTGPILYSRAFELERDPSIEPKPMLFPTLASPSGVITSEMPGYLVWDTSTKMLTATQGNDVGGGDEFRNVYRYAGRLFTLIRVETRKHGYEEAWTPVWEAPAWPPPHRQ